MPRHPSGRGVRGKQQPRFFEVGHHVADRRRRQILHQQPRHGARAYRLAGRDIAVDDQAKNLAAALVQLVDRRRGDGSRHGTTTGFIDDCPAPAATPRTAPAAGGDHLRHRQNLVMPTAAVNSPDPCGYGVCLNVA
jgi:hypothetical protein